MVDDMGIFRTTLGVSAMATPDHRRDLHDGSCSRRACCSLWRAGSSAWASLTCS